MEARAFGQCQAAQEIIPAHWFFTGALQISGPNGALPTGDGQLIIQYMTRFAGLIDAAGTDIKPV